MQQHQSRHLTMAMNSRPISTIVPPSTRSAFFKLKSHLNHFAPTPGVGLGWLKLKIS